MDNSLSWFDKRLNEFYRATFYHLDHLQHPLRVDDQSSELDQWLNDRQHNRWVFITAWNPASKPVTAHENLRAQSALRKTLRSKGWDYYPALAVDPGGKWPSEPSLFVPDMSVAQGADLAYAFRQNAFLAGNTGEAVKLHWTMASFSMMNDEC
jgi:hypothetical protein